jgi:hypothetical protein
MIDDRRFESQKGQTVAFIVATDAFLSHSAWCKGRSLFAVPLFSRREEQVVLDNMKHRSEMKRARFVSVAGPSNIPNCKLHSDDHLSIRNRDDCSRFFMPPYDGGFGD